MEMKEYHSRLIVYDSYLDWDLSISILLYHISGIIAEITIYFSRLEIERRKGNITIRIKKRSKRIGGRGIKED